MNASKQKKKWLVFWENDPTFRTSNLDFLKQLYWPFFDKIVTQLEKFWFARKCDWEIPFSKLKNDHISREIYNFAGRHFKTFKLRRKIMCTKFHFHPNLMQFWSHKFRGTKWIQSTDEESETRLLVPEFENELDLSILHLEPVQNKYL